MRIAFRFLSSVFFQLFVNYCCYKQHQTCNWKGLRGQNLPHNIETYLKHSMRGMIILVSIIIGIRHLEKILPISRLIIIH